MAHGNRKRNKRPHKRNKPSVLTEINSHCNEHSTKQLHDKMVSEQSTETIFNGVGIPRNVEQVKNIQKAKRRVGKISYDSLYSLHLLIHQLVSYIFNIKPTPDLEVMVGHPDIFAEVDRLLMSKDLNLECIVSKKRWRLFDKE